MTPPTVLVYSERYQEHDAGSGHPERPERAGYVYEFLKKSDLFQKLLTLTPRAASLDEVELVHPRSYIDRVKCVCDSGESFIDSMDTAICPVSYEVALLAAGGRFNFFCLGGGG